MNIRQLTKNNNDKDIANKLYNLLALHNDNLIFKRQRTDLDLMSKFTGLGMLQVRSLFSNVDAKVLANKLQLSLPEGYLPNHKKSNVFSVLMNIVHLVYAIDESNLTSDEKNSASYTFLRAIRVILDANADDVVRVFSGEEYPKYDSAIQHLSEVCNKIISRHAPKDPGSFFQRKQDSHKHERQEDSLDRPPAKRQRKED